MVLVMTSLGRWVTVVLIVAAMVTVVLLVAPLVAGVLELQTKVRIYFTALRINAN